MFTFVGFANRPKAHPVQLVLISGQDFAVCAAVARCHVTSWSAAASRKMTEETAFFIITDQAGTSHFVSLGSSIPLHELQTDVSM